MALWGASTGRGVNYSENRPLLRLERAGTFAQYPQKATLGHNLFGGRFCPEFYACCICAGGEEAASIHNKKPRNTEALGPEPSKYGIPSYLHVR